MKQLLNNQKGFGHLPVIVAGAAVLLIIIAVGISAGGSKKTATQQAIKPSTAGKAGTLSGSNGSTKSKVATESPGGDNPNSGSSPDQSSCDASLQSGFIRIKLWSDASAATTVIPTDNLTGARQDGQFTTWHSITTKKKPVQQDISASG